MALGLGAEDGFKARTDVEGGGAAIAAHGSSSSPQPSELFVLLSFTGSTPTTNDVTMSNTKITTKAMSPFNSSLRLGYC